MIALAKQLGLDEEQTRLAGIAGCCTTSARR
jgi:HD-GYP domain-containing protein (c-di-GMP phosphodiesterase class II)